MAVLAEGWYVDGVSVESFGTVLEDRSGWDDVPAMRGDDVTLLGRDGVSWRRKRYQPGRKPLTIGVHGADTTTWQSPATGQEQRALYERNLDGLLRMFAPRHRLLTVTRVHANGERRQAQCQVTSAVTPQVAGDSYGQVSIELAVPGVWWEDVDPITSTLTYDVSAGGTQACEVYALRGQTGYCTDAVVAVTGPCTTVSIVDTETGSGWSFGAIGAGQVLAVDSGAFTATLAGSSVLTSLALTSSPVLLEVSPAPYSYQGPTLTVATTGAATGFQVAVTSRRKWVR